MSDRVDFEIYKDKLLFVHERNILNKYNTNYKGRSKEFNEFYLNVYLKMREKLFAMTFDEDHTDDFSKATNILNEYYRACEQFSYKYKITSQSKFVSSFLEEISSYLFKDIPEIKSGEFGIYNKNIYAGLKLDNEKQVSVITKDVDFCIGKKVEVLLKDNMGHHAKVQIIVPIVAVEVKTYLDATMFGEVKSSSGAIRSASPNSRTYVLMGYKDLKDEHIIAARQDSALTEMFALRPGEGEPISKEALYEYWEEISNAIKNVSSNNPVRTLGRLLHSEDKSIWFINFRIF